MYNMYRHWSMKLKISMRKFKLGLYYEHFPQKEIKFSQCQGAYYRCRLFSSSVKQIKVKKKHVLQCSTNENLHNLKFSSICKFNSTKREYLLPLVIAFRGLKKKIPFDNGEDDSTSRLFIPITYKVSEFEEKVGEDIVGPLKKADILSVITRFYTDDEVKELAKEQGLDQYLFQQTTISFRKFCIDSDVLPTDLHIIFSDILKGASHIHDLYPYFYKHAKNIFPHLNCMDDLYKVSDLTQPPNWYPDARAIVRKIIFHAGPTNSGKTYHAMEQFLSAKLGVYCGPLKLLAVEVFEKSNERGTPCDLVTGEERKYAVSEEFTANHVSCTVEMTSVNTKYDVAIIDEIQMIKDPLRGWAWTRAFLGICASEIHVCGEAAAIELIKDLAMSVGEDVEVRRYKRLTSLTVEESALVSLDMVRPGDCIVCFGRQQIHSVAQSIERMGHEVAVIYGGLPPGAKLAQAKKFNDPEHPCKIMVATDAIGMGLNLSIRRIIFNSLVKPTVNEKGEKEMDTISVSSALQIAGRAGRYGTPFSEGFVTTFKSHDLPTLRRLLGMTPADIEQAGLHPTADQIELFAFHLPNYTLSNLIEIFVKLCTVDSSLYYMCVMDDFKFLADLIQHIALPLRARYIFCCAPISKKMPFVCAMFLKFSRQYSQNEPVTLDWLCRQMKWPFSTPKTIHELVHLEEVFDVFDLYLWLSYRFPEMFPDTEMVRGLQRELDNVIQLGVSHITQLLRNSDLSSVSASFDEELERERPPKTSIRNFGFFRDNDDGSKVRLRGARHSNIDSQNESSKEVSLSTVLPSRPKGQRLTERLLRQGIISQRMLKELKNEWEREMQNEDDFKSSENRKHRSKKKPYIKFD